MRLILFLNRTKVFLIKFLINSKKIILNLLQNKLPNTDQALLAGFASASGVVIIASLCIESKLYSKSMSSKKGIRQRQL